jgi:hypothetical protein
MSSPQGSHKQLRPNPLPGVCIDPPEAVAEVDTHLLPGAMGLTQHHGERLLEAPIQLGKLRMLVPLRMLGFLLLFEIRTGQCKLSN